MALQGSISKLFLAVYLILVGILSIWDVVPISTHLLDIFGIVVGFLLLFAV